MTKEEKIKRGEEIIKQLEIDVHDHTNKEKRLYAGEVLHAFSPFTYDAHFSREEIAIALADAEEQGKKLSFEIDMIEEVKIGKEIYKFKRYQVDGFRYKIVMV